MRRAVDEAETLDDLVDTQGHVLAPRVAEGDDAELRRALGNELPAIELLQFAGKLVDVTATRSYFG